MARTRITAAELAKSLNSADRPVYVLDAELTLLFCNRACAEWLGPEAPELIGRKCKYHSKPEATGPDAMAAGLCPPPTTATGRHVTATVCRIAGDDPPRYRRATFIAVGPNGEDPIALVAVLDGEDSTRPDAEVDATPDAEPGPIELHQQIRNLRREAAVRYGADRLLGTSPAIRLARAQIGLAAGSFASLLLVGPSGSGRRHSAAAVHYGGDPESAGPLVPLDCSVLGTEVTPSAMAALASATKQGHGTLLFDGIDQIAPDTQAELAAVLVGKPSPMRLIATAQRSLSELVDRDAFREDLAAALSTITVELPPLAARREDLPLLAQLFLEEANARGERQFDGITPEALDTLDAHQWPGNVDELAQVVAEAHGRAKGTEITPADLPERIHLLAEATSRPTRREETIVLDDFLARIERELINRALAQAKGNKAKAARLLGMTRPRLYRRLEQLGLDKE